MYDSLSKYIKKIMKKLPVYFALLLVFNLAFSSIVTNANPVTGGATGSDAALHHETDSNAAGSGSSVSAPTSANARMGLSAVPMLLSLEYVNEISDSGTYAYSGASDPILIRSGAQPTIVLNSAEISSHERAAITVEAGAALTLIIRGNNTLSGGPGFAGICVEPAYDGSWNYDIDGSGALTISGDGVLRAAGGDGDDEDGLYGGGAGIGGNGEDVAGDGVDFGRIVISDEFTGTIHAEGGRDSIYKNGSRAFGGGAGIGSGGFNMGYLDDYSDVGECYWGLVVGQIEIDGGTVYAKSNGTGSGIGGGSGQGEDSAESEIAVFIDGGTIYATGGICGAGIGGGSLCDGGTIMISGGDVTAAAGEPDGSMGGAGIGGGDNSSVTLVEISGGKVKATGNGGGAGIGGGTNLSYSLVHYGDTYGTRDRKGTITISGEDTFVTAKGGTGTGYSGKYGGAGIGSGYPVANNNRSVAFDIVVNDRASVEAYGGYHAQAIGYGYRPTDYTGYGIRLTLDDSISLWAENADFYQPALAAVTLYDVKPVTYSSGSTYLVCYVDENKDADTASSDEADGYFDSEGVPDTLNSGDVLADRSPAGNWATLYRAAPVPTTFKIPVEKKVEGSPDTEETFKFKLEAITEDAPMPESHEAVITGEGTVEFKEITYGEEGVYEYRISEEAGSTEGYDYDNGSWLAVVTVEKSSGNELAAAAVYKKNGIASDKIVFTNTYTAPLPPTGSLSVKATVSGSGADDRQEFGFIVELGDPLINGLYGDMTFVNGTASFVLKHNESKTASGLPAGISWKVTESQSYGYDVSVNGEKTASAYGSIAADTVTQVIFNNHKDAKEPEVPESTTAAEETEVPESTTAAEEESTSPPRHSGDSDDDDPYEPESTAKKQEVPESSPAAAETESTEESGESENDLADTEPDAEKETTGPDWSVLGYYSDIPPTGDNSHMLLWLLGLAGSLAGIICMILLLRRKER